MSRYTPKHRKPVTKPSGAKKKGAKAPAKKSKPKPTGKFVCKVCEKAFRTEEALATHALDAHGQPLDLEAMSPVAPNMVRCPECGMPVRKRNLQQHLRFIHELVG
jgi:hypothetical protein